MILLKLISWPYARKHLLRATLTTVGIVLGVAVFVGIHLANGSVLAAFNRTVDRIAGKAQLQITAGEPGFDEEVLERVQALPEVGVAVPAIEAPVETGLKGQGNLLILGVDMTGDRSLRDYDLEGEGEQEEVVEDPLVFLAQPDSLIVTREFASRNGLRIDSRLSLGTMEGPRQFTVRGIMRSEGLGAAFGGNLAVMDIYAAQKVFGRGRRFDRIDVAAAEGVSIADCRRAIQAALGPGFQIEPPSSRGKQFESLLRVYSMLMNVNSLFALFIGVFLIYNSFAIAVTQRRPEIGILRALGATRGQIRALFLGEGALAGLFGSIAGVLAGIVMARVLAGYTTSVMQGVYGVSESAREIEASPGLIAAALAMGMAASLVGAFLPARNAARVDPVQALQKGKYQVLTAGENRARRIAAALLAAGALTPLLFTRSRPAFYMGYVMMALCALLLTPTLALWLARLFRPLLRWIRPVEGALAADSLLQAPRRTSATVAAVMLSLALVIGLAGLARAGYAAIQEWLDTTLNPDLYVSASSNLVTRSYHFPDSMTSELRALEGVEEIQRVRSSRILFRGGVVMLVSLEMESIARRTPRRRPVAGDLAAMHRLAAQGKAVIISESLAQLQNLRMGDILEVAAPRGLLRLPVAGILRDYSDQQGSIFLDRSVYLRWWNDSSADIFRIYLKPGVRAEDLKARILERFAGQRRLFVLLNHEVREYILRLTDQWFGMSYIQLAVAVLVAVLGIVNTLTVSIADRRRELGILRAVGGLAAQIRGTIWMEALAIGLISLALGLGLGAVNLLYDIEMARRDFAGMTLDYRYPFGMALALVPILLGAAWVSALAPAETAVRGSLTEALEYE
ncbi:MAG: FtsX-like permease family protein [Bryobacterales bacterium]|nr:FtsX-like permease family protein [Bryobacterales bacterium]